MIDVKIPLFPRDEACENYDRIQQKIISGQALDCFEIPLYQLFQRRLEFMAVGDTLHPSEIGAVANKAGFKNCIPQVQAQVNDPNYTGNMVVLNIDLDNFKMLNDNNGHAAGDDALEKTGLYLATRLRKGDMVARMGGDEYNVFCPNVTDVSDFVHGHIADMVREYDTIAVPKALQAIVSMSAGAASIYPNERVANALVRADFAMLYAKAAGKGKVELYDPQKDYHAMISERPSTRR